MTDKFSVSPELQAKGLADRDTLYRFLFDVKPAQGLWVNVNKTLKDSLEHQPKYPLAIKKLLGELLLVGSILKHYLKTDGTFNLAIQSKDTPVNALSVSLYGDSARVFALLDEKAEVADNAKLEDLINPQANLIMSVYYDNRAVQPYQSIIQINLNSIQESITDYYKYSVQIPAFIRLASEVDANGDVNAAGFFTQYIPDESGTVDDFKDLTTLATTLQDNELLQLAPNDLLYRLFNQEEVTLSKEKDLKFSCTCSYEKYLNAIASLGEQEVAAHPEEEIMATCSVCSKDYHYGKEQILAYIKAHPDE